MICRSMLREGNASVQRVWVFLSCTHEDVHSPGPVLRSEKICMTGAVHWHDPAGWPGRQLLGLV